VNLRIRVLLVELLNSECSLFELPCFSKFTAPESFADSSDGRRPTLQTREILPMAAGESFGEDFGFAAMFFASIGRGDPLHGRTV
jgi:hypothetical protein